MKRGDNHFASLYLNSVKNEIAVLLRAKDFLNASLFLQVSQLAAISHKVLAFHISIAIIAVVAVILCLALLCCSFRYTDTKQNVLSYKFDNSKFGYNHNQERNDSVYILDSDDKTKILGTNSYNKQFFWYYLCIYLNQYLLKFNFITFNILIIAIITKLTVH